MTTQDIDYGWMSAVLAGPSSASTTTLAPAAQTSGALTDTRFMGWISVSTGCRCDSRYGYVISRSLNALRRVSVEMQ
jgi:hypothetical protein